MMGKLHGIGGVFGVLGYLAIAIALLLLIPRIVTYSIVNAAEREWTRTLLTEDSDSEWWTQPLLQSLDKFVPGRSVTPARYALANAALATGDYQLAAEAWHIQDSQPERLPLHVVQRYLQDEVVPSRTARDTIAHGYIQNAEADLRAGNLARARSSLEGILLLRPADLYAHFQLRQLALQNGQVVSAQQHEDALQQYAIEAIAPSTTLLIPSVDRILPTLIDENIWDYAKAQRVVAFIVWQYSGVEESVSLLQALAERYPNDANWPFYLGELYHRRQNWQQAEKGYLRVLDIDAEYAPAYLRLGMLAEQESVSAASTEQLAWRERALTWYRQYLQRVPNDPVGQQRLADVAARIGTAQTSDRLADPEDLNDDHYLASRLLNISPDKLLLGANRLSEDGLNRGTVPEAFETWSWLQIAGPPIADQALFTGGQDQLPGQGSSPTRIDGLWQQTGTGNARSRAGFRHMELSMPPNAIWLVAFSYSTSAEKGERIASVRLTSTRASGFAGEMYLPATHGTWRREAILVRNRTGQPLRIMPQITNWTTQSHWFDQVTVRPINFEEAVAQQVPNRLTTWQLP